MRYLILLLFTISLISCGPLNTVNTNNNDGIYGNKVEVSNNNSAFYKNYFEQKSDELGINSSINDSVLTDINSYSSNTNVSYTNSNGSWGDNPTSVNIIFRDRYVYKPYMNYYPYGYNWYDNYISSNWYRWRSPWGFNYPRYGMVWLWLWLWLWYMECGITGGGIHTTMDQIIMIRITTETIIELPT